MGNRNVSAGAGLWVGAVLLMIVAACGGPSQEPNDAAPDRDHRPPADHAGELQEPAAPAARDPDVFLPALDQYRTQDDGDTGELEESLSHASFSYDAMARRLVLDDEGFVAGEVIAVTFPPGSAATETYLDHQFGPAPRTSTVIGGYPMLWLEAESQRVLAWKGSWFVVTFRRGQEQDEEWLVELARASATATEAISGTEP